MRKPNISIIHTRITDKIRVSSAAIYYDEYFGDRYQYETWCFSDDPRQRSFQVIHGSYYKWYYDYILLTIRVHQHIVKNLKKKEF
jgi:hypothetical protein